MTRSKMLIYTAFAIVLIGALVWTFTTDTRGWPVLMMVAAALLAKLALLRTDRTTRV